jgi:hypothetical protein
MSYRVVRALAGGGFSDLFEVEDTASALPERLILKRLNAEMSSRPAVRAAFADEAKILRELRHPCIVTFRRCYFDEEQRVCLLMEKVSGEPLDAWARRHAARAAEVLDVFEKVLQAVDYLHHRPTPFLHLDLKPENLLVSSTPQGPQPVVIDFGIARRSGDQGLKAYTPPYGAPEQTTGRTIDCSTDVHALGQILAELLEVIELPEAVRQALLGVAARARQPVRRMRFSDAGDMGLAFRRARRGTPHRTPVPFPVPQLAHLPRWVFGAATAALLAALVGVLWMAAPAAEPPQPKASPAPAESELRAQFASLLATAREAAQTGRFGDADVSIVAAKSLWQSVPPNSENALEMARDLEALRSEIDLMRQGGFLGEGVRLVQ